MFYRYLLWVWRFLFWRYFCFLWRLIKLLVVLNKQLTCKNDLFNLLCLINIFGFVSGNPENFLLSYKICVVKYYLLFHFSLPFLVSGHSFNQQQRICFNCIRFKRIWDFTRYLVYLIQVDGGKPWCSLHCNRWRTIYICFQTSFHHCIDCVQIIILTH